MAQAIGVKELTDLSATEYVERHTLLGTRRESAYLAMALANIHGSFVAGNADRARMLTLGTLMALDQSLLDGQWELGSRLTGLPLPRWHLWHNQDTRPSARAARSLLAEPEWIAAAIGKSKDEGYVKKNRTQSQGRGKGKEKGDQSGALRQPSPTGGVGG